MSFASFILVSFSFFFSAFSSIFLVCNFNLLLFFLLYFKNYFLRGCTRDYKCESLPLIINFELLLTILARYWTLTQFHSFLLLLWYYSNIYFKPNEEYIWPLSQFLDSDL
jgi:hypothetical protein